MRCASCTRVRIGWHCGRSDRWVLGEREAACRALTDWFPHCSSYICPSKCPSRLASLIIQGNTSSNQRGLPSICLASAWSKNSSVCDIINGIPELTNHQASLCHVTTNFGSTRVFSWWFGLFLIFPLEVIRIQYTMMPVQTLYRLYSMAQWSSHIIKWIMLCY